MNVSDNNILKQIANDDLVAFEKLFKSSYEELCRFAAGYLKDMDQAEETVQDVFFTLWTNRKGIKVKQSLRAYLFTMTKNKCLKVLRSKGYEEKYKLQGSFVQQGSVSTPADELNAKELYTIIEKTLDALPERTRIIFKLSRDEGLKYHEIAEKLSISIKTVEANMGKALKAFRRKLTEYKEAS